MYDCCCCCCCCIHNITVRHKMGGFCCIMPRRYCIVCMHWWQQMRAQSLMITKKTCSPLSTHCSTTTPTKWKQQNTCYLFYAGAPQRGCWSYRCGTRHHFPPLKRRRRKQCIVWIELKCDGENRFYSLNKTNDGLNNKAQTLQCHTCALEPKMWHYWRLLSWYYSPVTTD